MHPPPEELAEHAADVASEFLAGVPHVLEVSIGHALIGEALYDGLALTVARYRRLCQSQASA